MCVENSLQNYRTTRTEQLISGLCWVGMKKGGLDAVLLIGETDGCFGHRQVGGRSCLVLDA